jgi:hypothetical protein
MTDPTYVLRITVTDQGNGCVANLEAPRLPAYKRRAAVQAAQDCLDDIRGEMDEAVRTATYNSRRKRT